MFRSSTINRPLLPMTLAMALVLVLVSALSVPSVVFARSFSEADLRAAASGFPAMPVDSFSLAQLLGRPTSFGSGGPFNDLEFTTFNTDYIDGENGGFDTFMPAAPSRDYPGADRIRYVRTVLNTDLGEGAELGPRGQQMLDRIFEMHDLDDDGSITQAELSRVREERFRQADRNGDGQLDSDKLEALREAAPPGNGRRRLSRGGERFDALDADADGAISLDEFYAIGYPMLERADADGDGVISRAELESSFSRASPRRPR